MLKLEMSGICTYCICNHLICTEFNTRSQPEILTLMLFSSGCSCCIRNKITVGAMKELSQPEVPPYGGNKNDCGSGNGYTCGKGNGSGGGGDCRRSSNCDYRVRIAQFRLASLAMEELLHINGVNKAEVRLIYKKLIQEIDRVPFV